jgi:glycosyltransferase involved in cell wall biosynthesis
LPKKVIVRGPALTQSGYGEHTRFVLRALRLQEPELEIHVIPTNWGQTGWIAIPDEEREWIDKAVQDGAKYIESKQPYDISVQVTIPNEWEKMAPINIGVTAGIETNAVSPSWIEKSNMMDKAIVVSEHAKYGFDNTIIKAQTDRGEVTLVNSTPIEVCGYPVKHFEETNLDLDLEHDFNYLAIAQWGPRKNLENLIRWFVEENYDRAVGLIVKTSIKNNSILDREHTEALVKNAIPDIPDRKCKIHLLHGDMTEPEIHSLYTHPKIKVLACLTHGEGFGLPIFEAAYSGLPIIAPGWSGHVDFLYIPQKSKSKKKNKKKAHYAEVDFTLGPVPESAVWPGVIEKQTMWCYPTEGSFKLKLRQVYKNYEKTLKRAETLKDWVQEEFAADRMLKKLSHALVEPSPAEQVKTEDLPKVSIITSVYDGDEYIRPFLEDITKQTIFEDKCELILINADSPGNEEETIQEYLEKYPDNIIYKRLDKDPGIYGVWNKGVGMASGEYLTNANLDDRKAPNSLERHARELYTNDDIDLVYADMIITDKPNETFEINSSDGRRYNFPNFSLDNLKMTNMPHASPMWRKSYHDSYGLFDPDYQSAGDWEMWLRGATQGSKFKKINAALGLYYFNPTGISTNPDNFGWKREEEKRVFKKYQ